MTSTKRTVRWGAVASFVAAGLLLAMIVVGIAAGAEVASLEHPQSAEQASRTLSRQSETIRLMMVIDDLFVIAYAVAFIGLGALVRLRASWLGVAGLIVGLLAAGFDFGENSLTLGLIAGIEAGLALTPGHLLLLNWVGLIKFLLAYLALTLFALGLWDRPALNRLTAGLTLLFPVIGVVGQVNLTAGLLRVLWMLPLLLLAGLLLWRRGEELSV